MWTKQALLDAKPMSLPEVTDAAAPVEEALIGEAGMVAGAAPSPEADAIAMADFPEDWQALAFDTDVPTLDEPYGTSNVYTVHLSNYFSQFHTYFPYRAIGKLFFTTPSGTSYCTASVISPYNVIVTAGHCVINWVNDGWYSGWRFYPAYRNGVAPYSSFPGLQAWALTNYLNTGLQRYDVAVIKLGNNTSGRAVTYYTGYLGRSWNYAYVQNMVSFGYPSNLSSGTVYTYQCLAETFQYQTDTIGMGCNMTYGSSGGPWIRVFYPYLGGARNYVSSVVSGGNPSYPTFYGARFSSYNIVPLCSAAGC
jgi:hypothetical protein